jgi:hypothetical protein
MRNLIRISFYYKNDSGLIFSLKISDKIEILHYLRAKIPQNLFSQNFDWPENR